MKCYNSIMDNIDTKDKHYNTVDELIEQANKHLFIPFGVLDKTGRIQNLKDKGKLGTIVEEAIFEIKINNRPEPDIPNLKVELKTTPFKRNKNGSISAKERTVLNIIDFNRENLEDFYASHLWDKCSQILRVMVTTFPLAQRGKDTARICVLNHLVVCLQNNEHGN